MSKTALVYVCDVYGRRARVCVGDLENADKIFLPLYNQLGGKLSATPGRAARGRYTHIHRDNIAKAE